MSLVRNLLCGAVLSFALAPAAMAEEEPAIDPYAAEIITRTGEFMASRGNIEVRWFVTYDEILDGREKLTRMRGGYSLLSRSNGYYTYVEDGQDTYELFFDGSTLALYDLDLGAYAIANMTGNLERLIDRAGTEYGLEIPIWSVLSARYRGRYLDEADTAAYLGITRVAGQEAHHLALSNYDEDWQVWISTNEDMPVLLAVAGTDPYTQGWPQYRVFFSDWEFAPEIEDGMFTFVPEGDTEQMVWPRAGSE